MKSMNNSDHKPNFNLKLTIEDHKNLHKGLRIAHLSPRYDDYGSSYLLIIMFDGSLTPILVSHEEWVDLSGRNITITSHLGKHDREYVTNFFGLPHHYESRGKFFYEGPDPL